MTAQARVMGMAHCIGAGALGWGTFHASLHGHPVWALILGGLCMGVLMLGLTHLSGDLE